MKKIIGIGAILVITTMMFIPSCTSAEIWDEDTHLPPGCSSDPMVPTGPPPPKYKENPLPPLPKTTQEWWDNFMEEWTIKPL